MRINTNITALNTYNSYTSANNKIASSVAKLSSGYSINSAADNAAGLAISEKMRAQIRGLDKASSNSQTAISLAQTAEGSLESSGEILQRMREISVQSSSDTNEDNIDRDALQAEFSQLQSELDEIAQDSTFNNQHLLNGNLATKKTSSGAGTSLAGSGMNVSFGNADAGTYGFGVKVVTTQAAVDASKPSAATFAASTLDSRFSGAAVSIGTDAAKSAVLNGNYTLSAKYDTSSDKITVTAAGDNGQTFTKELTDDDIGVLNTTTGNTLTLDFGSSAFSVTLTPSDTLVAGTDASPSEMSALADAIKGTFTVSGGTNAVEEKKAVMASLDGASDVELKAGMSSVTFDNGITVSFDKLTSADLDTNAYEATNIAFAGADTNAATISAVTASVGKTASLSSLSAQSYVFSSSADNSTGIITVNATGLDGKTYSATLDGSKGAAASSTVTLNFGERAFSLDMTVGSAGYTNASGLQGAIETALSSATMLAADSATAVASSSASMTGAVASGNITGSTVAAGADAITSNFTNFKTTSTTGNVTITATGTNGETYTATLTLAADAGIGANAALAFTDASGHDAFTITLANTAIAGNAASASAIGTALGSAKVSTIATSAAITDSDTNVAYNFEGTFGDSGSTDTVAKASKSTVEVVNSTNSGLTIQVGANTGDEMEINIERADAEYLGVKGLDVSTQESASKAVDAVNSAINQVSSQRAYLGAVQNRLTYKIDNLTTSSQNLTSAESSIRDVDMASEMTKFTNAQILSQASTAMLAQANSLPQNVLSLLK